MSRIPSIDEVATLVEAAEGLVSALPKGEPENKIVRTYLNAVRRWRRIEGHAKVNAKRRGLKLVAKSQMRRAEKWAKIAAEHKPLVEKIINGGDRQIPFELPTEE